MFLITRTPLTIDYRAPGLAAFGLLLALLATTSAPPTRREFGPRCYRVVLSDIVWGSEPLQSYAPLPERLELMDSVVEGPPKWHAARRSPPGPEGDNASWMQRGDTMIVRLPRHWSYGLLFHVAKSASDTLVGRMDDYVDYDPRQAARGVVRLVPIQCDS